MRLVGKVAIITGGADGIGRETALLFGQEGARVVIVDCEPDKGADVERQLQAKGVDASFIKTDVRSAADVSSMAQRTLDRFGKIDILVNCAGTARVVPVTELPEDDWDRVVDTNLKGIYLCCKHVLPSMIAGGGGAIVNIASVLGLVGRARASAYNAAKAGVIGLTKNLALDYVAANVRVNAVCPGFVDTELIRRYVNASPDPGAAYDELVQLHPMGRLARPVEIAHSILFLASDESSFVTGSSLVVDGGYSAR